MANESLLEGAFTGNLNIIKDSVEKGANVNHTKRDGISALAIASYHGFQQIAEYLVENGADVNIIDRYQFATPLAVAVRANQTETVKYLLRKGADVNLTEIQRNEEAESPLMIAIEKGNLEMVKLLVENGANISGSFVPEDINENVEILEYFKVLKHGPHNNQEIILSQVQKRGYYL